MKIVLSNVGNVEDEIRKIEAQGFTKYNGNIAYFLISVNKQLKAQGMFIETIDYNNSLFFKVVKL